MSRPTEQPTEQPLRVASWNIRDLTGDPEAVRSVLRRLEADLVCLQEAPRRPGAVPLRVLPLARAIGMRMISGGRGSGGTAVLAGSRVQVLQAQVRRLPVRTWYTRTRGVSLAAIRIDAGAAAWETAVASLHLPLTREQRLLHAELIGKTLADGGGALRELVGTGRVIVAGDFNEPPVAPGWARLTGMVADPDPESSPTFPARSPGVRLDAVLIGSGLSKVSYGSGSVPAGLLRRASDHLPVLCEIVPASVGR